MTQARAAVVVGVGAQRGLGAALAHRFASEGLHVFVVGRTADKLEAVAQAIRSAGGQVTPRVADAGSERDVVDLFEAITAQGLALELAVYNAGSFAAASVLDLGVAQLEQLWRENCLGGFVVGREAARRMVPQGRGTILFTGATASLRARPPFLGFAAAKASLRAVAQGMARELGPRGIHVAHVIIDGVIDGERARGGNAGMVAQKGDDGLLAPEAIADCYWSLHSQHRSTWTHEVDLRPFKEPF